MAVDQAQSGVPEGWTIVSPAAPSAPSGGQWEDRGIAGKVWHPAAPPTNPRADDKIVGVEDAGMIQKAADWASKLPPKYQRFGGIMAAVPGELLKSFVEALSTPESVAGMGSGLTSKAVDAAGAVASRVGATAGKALDVVDPDLVSIASPRAGAALKKAQQVRDVLSNRAQPAAAQTPMAAGYDRYLPNVSGIEPGAAPPASAPATPAPAAVAGPPQVPPPSPAGVPAMAQPFYPQKALNELAIAARRAGVKLSETDYANAMQAVQQGAAPADVIAGLKTSAAPATTAMMPDKVKLSAPEAKVYIALRTQGMSGVEALEAIAAQRALQARYGLGIPSAADVRFPSSKAPTR